MPNLVLSHFTLIIWRWTLIPNSGIFITGFYSKELVAFIRSTMLRIFLIHMSDTIAQWWLYSREIHIYTPFGNYIRNAHKVIANIYGKNVFHQTLISQCHCYHRMTLPHYHHATCHHNDISQQTFGQLFIFWHDHVTPSIPRCVQCPQRPSTNATDF